jgi:hypothetical protein
MEIKYSLTLDDMVDLNLFRIRILPEIARRQKMMRWGYLVIMLFLTIFLYLTGINLVVCLLMVAIIVGFFFYFPQYQKRQLRRMLYKDYKDPEREKVLKDRLAVTDDIGIELTTIKGKRRFGWGDFATVERKPDALFVLFSDKNSFTITRSGVTEGDYDAFVEEIARKSGKGEIIDLPAA